MDEEALPHVLSVCSALGGFEEDAEVLRPSHEQPQSAAAEGPGAFSEGGTATKKRKVLRYVPGDECLECLRDLKRYLRVDSKSSKRLVFFALGSWGILRKDLIPLLLLNCRLVKDAEALGKRNERAEKTAQAVVELLAPLTWPVDAGTENLEGQIDILRDYKKAFLEKGVLSCIVQTVLVPLSLPNHARTARDTGLIHLALSLFRNLLAIPDADDSVTVSAEQHCRAFMHEELILRLNSECVLDLLLTFASSSDEEQFSQYNIVVLEIFNWILHGVDPEDLFKDSKRLAAEALNRVITRDKFTKGDPNQAVSRTRHSNFGGTIVLQTQNAKYNVHKNIAAQECLQVLDESKKPAFKKAAITDPYDVHRRIRNPEASRCLRQVAELFLQCCFNPFMVSVRKDIELERAKVQDEHKRHFLRLFSFFLCFQRLAMNTAFADAKARRERELLSAEELHELEIRSDFDLVGGLLDQRGIRILLKTIREAKDDKPPDYELLHVGVDCLRNLLLTLAAMQESEHQEYRDVSDVLQNSLYHEGTTLDILNNLVRTYKPEMSRGYLQTLVNAVHVLLKVVEKYAGSKGSLYVRKKKSKRKKRASNRPEDRNGNMSAEGETQEDGGGHDSGDDDDDGGVGDENADAGYTDASFDFRAYVRRYAHEAVVRTYCLLLEDLRLLPVPTVKCVAALFHRVVFDAGAAAVFFSLSTIERFHRALEVLKATDANEKTRAHGDLEKVLLHVVRLLFKKLKERPLLYVELVFPKTRPIVSRIDHDDDAREVTSAVEKGRAAALAAERAAAAAVADPPAEADGAAEDRSAARSESSDEDGGDRDGAGSDVEVLRDDVLAVLDPQGEADGGAGAAEDRSAARSESSDEGGGDRDGAGSDVEVRGDDVPAVFDPQGEADGGACAAEDRFAARSESSGKDRVRAGSEADVCRDGPEDDDAWGTAASDAGTDPEVAVADGDVRDAGLADHPLDDGECGTGGRGGGAEDVDGKGSECVAPSGDEATASDRSGLGGVPP